MEEIGRQAALTQTQGLPGELEKEVGFIRWDREIKPRKKQGIYLTLQASFSEGN